MTIISRMKGAQKPLPKDVAACHALIFSMQEQLACNEKSLSSHIEQQRVSREQLRIHQEQQRVQQEQINALKAELERVFEKLRLARLRFFGRSSEKHSPDQRSLVFNEAETQASIAPSESLGEDVAADPTPPRKRKPRRTLAQSVPAGTPVVDIVHDLPEAQRRCPHDGHALHVIGEEVSHQIDITLPKIELQRHVRLKYGCRCCEQGVHTAPLAPQCLPGTLATASTAALIITSKFVDHLPFYRQTFAFKRIGLAVTRATLCQWTVKLGDLVVPLLNLLEEKLNGGDYLQIDESPLQVLREPGRSPQQQSYMWVRRALIEDKRIVLYHYSERRNGEVARELVDAFTGRYLQHDDCKAYNRVQQPKRLTHLGCHAHARRYFVNALKLTPKKQRAASVAQEAIDFYKQLYRIEDEIRGKPPQERLRRRQLDSVPILEQFEQWWREKLPAASPGTALGKALGYLAQQWPRLRVYVDDGALEIDNNGVENAIRPFAVGRKNWLFNTTPHGATASARLYSLIETAKANGLDPYFYLRFVFKELPKAQTLEDVERLLPWNCTPQSLIDG